MYQAAPMIYPNLPIAPPGLMYPLTLPGYNIPGQIYLPPPPLPPLPSPLKQALWSAPLPVIKPRSITPPPRITPSRDWLLDTLNRLIFANNGVLIGDYPVFELRKKNAIELFRKQVAELYPSDKYLITEEWLISAMANPDFMPDTAAIRQEDYRVAIRQMDFQLLAQAIARDIEPYFQIQLESNNMIENGIMKAIVSFKNSLVPQGLQMIVYSIGSNINTGADSGSIPSSEFLYQHDYLVFDGKAHRLLDVYPYLSSDAHTTNIATNATVNETDTSMNPDAHSSVDKSIITYEVINNIQNDIAVFMAHMEMDRCVEIILAARNRVRDKVGVGIVDKPRNEKKEKDIMFDKFISSSVKLDFYVRVRIRNGIGIHHGEDGFCARCKDRVGVGIESGDLVCSTKCCRRTMHPSCLLELYLHEDINCAEFHCDKCNVQRPDKYGRNTEMLMGLCGL
jgi:hypothetical protein